MRFPRHRALLFYDISSKFLGNTEIRLFQTSILLKLVGVSSGQMDSIDPVGVDSTWQPEKYASIGGLPHPSWRDEKIKQSTLL